MKPDVVVDVGNSRIKWGRCADGRVTAIAALPPDDPSAWKQQLVKWNLGGSCLWAVAGVHPQRRDTIAGWLKEHRHSVLQIDDGMQLPIPILIDNPNQVGIDRLLNAIAACQRVPRDVCRIIVDAGTAVTVDCVDERGRFRGGAILPGFRLMGQALRNFTAQLPLVEQIESPVWSVPASSTRTAIEAGIFWAVAGGVRALVRNMTAWVSTTRERELFLTGGAASLLAPVMDTDAIVWPEMTLEGIRISAEARS